MPQHIIVVDYNPLWHQLFKEEAERIEEILGANLVAIYHIGSTSVPFLAAKPVIDIMPVVKDLDAEDGKKDEFEAIGYEYLGEYGMENRRYLRKGGDERTHQIHIFEKNDDENISRHLAFRDYLRAHRNVADEYAALKRVLALKFPYDIEGYSDGKDDFVKRIEKAALEEYGK